MRAGVYNHIIYNFQPVDKLVCHVFSTKINVQMKFLKDKNSMQKVTGR